MRKAMLFLIACAINVSLFSQGTWRPLTDSEEAFVSKVERRLTELLNDASSQMPGKWDIKIDYDKYMRHQLDQGQHDGRPHEVRAMLTMDYQPNEEEQKKWDDEIDRYYKSIGERTLTDADVVKDPSHKYHINVVIVVNYYLFMPVNTQEAVQKFGDRVNIPNVVFGFTRKKELGTGAPFYMLYIGDYSLVNQNNAEVLKENFNSTPPSQCTNARTIVMEVHSNLGVAADFLSKFNMGALRQMLVDL